MLGTPQGCEASSAGGEPVGSGGEQRETDRQDRQPEARMTVDDGNQHHSFSFFFGRPRRAGSATGDGLNAYLYRVPSTTPVPGDEFPS